jgi:hypothetical protein
MPHTIDWFSDHTEVVFSGQVTYQELRDTGASHYSDSRFDDIKFVILDFTSADLTQITPDKTTVLASIDSTAVAYNSSLKLAFVISDEYQRSLCEKYIKDSIGFRSSWAHRIFFDIEEARQWCDRAD